MSDNNKIFDDKYRENFLRSADPIALNDYLKNMQRLSQKGGKYLDMYNKDMIYLLDLNDTVYQDGGNLGSIFSNNNIMSQQSELPPNTEAYIDKLHGITQKTIIKKGIVPVSVSELEIIKQTLQGSNQSKESTKKTIIQFIDIVLYCDSVFMKEYDTAKINNLKELFKIITNNHEYMMEAFMYLTKILQTNKNKISEELMKEYIELRKKKPNINPHEYKYFKDKLTNDYINKIGTEKVYASKFVEKIINAYKRSKNN